MGDHADVVMTEDACEARAEGASGTCFSVVYAPEGEMGWAGVSFQYPLNNWGTEPGLCIGEADKVVFKAKGAAGGELVTFGAAGEDGSVETLTTEWTDYEVSVPSGYAESGESGGVASGFTWTAASAQGDITFYVDDIRWVAD